jgi:hypothetical protein
MIHLVMWAAFQKQVDMRTLPTLLKSISQIPVAMLDASCAQTLLATQRRQARGNVRRTLALAEWIHSLATLQADGIDVSRIVADWNKDCRDRGSKDALEGRKFTAIKRWIRYKALVMKVFLPYLRSVIKNSA